MILTWVATLLDFPGTLPNRIQHITRCIGSRLQKCATDLPVQL